MDAIKKKFDTIIETEILIKKFLNKDINVLTGIISDEDYYRLPENLRKKYDRAKILYGDILRDIEILKAIDPEKSAELPDALKYPYLR